MITGMKQSKLSTGTVDYADTGSTERTIVPLHRLIRIHREGDLRRRTLGRGACGASYAERFQVQETRIGHLADVCQAGSTEDRQHPIGGRAEQGPRL
jgi:hypothetical protein